MSLPKTKLFIWIFILLVYANIGIFGLFHFSHTAETPPMANCLYTQNSYSICKNILDHVSRWQEFSNITISSSFIFSFLILGIILYFYNKQNFSNQNQYFYKWKYYLNNPKPYTYQERIIKWLSLFENSPPFLYKT